jgi:L-ascorbate metabolism protein UlaG (beta-lactamase superfamily)
VLLLSHAHMDHLDLPTLSSFGRETFTVSADATADVLADAGLKRITELRWGDRAVFKDSRGELHIEAVEVKHWGERWPSKQPRGYNGYVLRREGKALLFGGDTALTPALKQLKPKGPFQVGILPIGAYRPWIWNHCTPEQAVSMANAAGVQYIVPVHHQTFRLSEEPKNEPIERLEAALANEKERVALSKIGQTFECPA